jgi:hypothetical protein
MLEVLLFLLFLFHQLYFSINFFFPFLNLRPCLLPFCPFCHAFSVLFAPSTAVLHASLLFLPLLHFLLFLLLLLLLAPSASVANAALSAISHYSIFSAASTSCCSLSSYLAFATL